MVLRFDSSGNVLCGSIYSEGNEDAIGISNSGQYVYAGGDLDGGDTTIFANDTLGGGEEFPFIARWQYCYGEEQGISQLKIESGELTVFPNPFTNSTTVLVNPDSYRDEGKHYLEVYDITRIKLQSIEFTGKQYELSAQGLAKGMYFIRVFDGQNALIGASKIVVQ